MLLSEGQEIVACTCKGLAQRKKISSHSVRGGCRCWGRGGRATSARALPRRCSWRKLRWCQPGQTWGIQVGLLQECLHRPLVQSLCPGRVSAVRAAPAHASSRKQLMMSAASSCCSSLSCDKTCRSIDNNTTHTGRSFPHIMLTYLSGEAYACINMQGIGQWRWLSAT